MCIYSSITTSSKMGGGQRKFVVVGNWKMNGDKGCGSNSSLKTNYSNGSNGFTELKLLLIHTVCNSLQCEASGERTDKSTSSIPRKGLHRRNSLAPQLLSARSRRRCDHRRPRCVLRLRPGKAAEGFLCGSSGKI